MPKRPSTSRKPSTNRANPELRPIDSHHNELSEGDKIKLFNVWVDRVERLNARKDDAIADIRNARKQYKADGLELTDLNDALRQRKKGQEWAALRVAAQLRVAEWLGKPLGFQSALDLGEPVAAQ